jgi:hypothetical protein
MLDKVDEPSLSHLVLTKQCDFRQFAQNRKCIRVKYLLTLAAALTVLLVDLIGEHGFWAQAAPPPPVIVPQVTPQFNNPGPQVKIPQPGNPLQQRTISPGPQIVPSRSARSVAHPRHHAAKHRDSSRQNTRSKQHSEGTSSREPPGQPKTTEAEKTPIDIKLKELDDALAKKLKGICVVANGV